MTKLPLEEQEVCLSMSLDEPGTWHCYTDSPKMQERLEEVGAVLVRTAKVGPGKFYTLKAEQIVLRKGKKELSPERKAQLGAQLNARRKTTSTPVFSGPIRAS